ncbi:MAG: lyase family protein [Symbiobacteriaceae bacterium]|nr:lyase family protein [Symbiobacteriaceae bacterium]
MSIPPKPSGGFYERTQGGIHPAVVEHYYKDRLVETAATSVYLLQVMRAHICMLAKQEIIPREAAGKLAALLTSWQDGGGITAAMLDPALEDLYINMEHLVKQELGEEIAGMMPVARSRNDVEAAMWRLELREKLELLATSAINHCEVLEARAAVHLADPLPGYTYHQQAQPLTLGFQLSAASAALHRDAERIIDCLERLDINPLGGAALCGSGYPIDRPYTSALLGFRETMDNCVDGVAACDYMLEAAYCGMQLLVTLGRLAEEVIKWCQNEVGFASLPDSLIDSSTIMPHKRNPVIPATVRAISRQKAGEFAGIAAACTVPFEASRDVTTTFDKAAQLVLAAWDMCEISAAYSEGIIFHPAKMRSALSLSFAYSTELADTLVREGGLTFRQAHSIVGGAVSQLFDAGASPEDMSYTLLNEWCLKITGSSLPISAEVYHGACDIDENIARRNHIGGTAPTQVAHTLRERIAVRARLRQRLEENSRRWQAGEEQLRQACRNLV